MDLTVQHLSSLPSAERDKRLNAAERRLCAIDHDTRPKASRIEQTAVLHLQAGSRSE
jgi:hypothetical protein